MDEITAVAANSTSPAWNTALQLCGLPGRRDLLNEPSMLLVQVNGEIQWRWFGQKLPKGTSAIGVVTARGTIFTIGDIVVPEPVRRVVSLLHVVSPAGGGELNGFRFTRGDIVTAVREQLLALGQARHSDVRPPATLSLALAFTIGEIRQLRREHTGMITDPVPVVVSDFDRYPLLALTVWMVDHGKDVGVEDLARFLYGGNPYGNAAWVRTLWVRMAMSEPGLLDRFEMAAERFRR